MSREENRKILRQLRVDAIAASQSTKAPNPMA